MATVNMHDIRWELAERLTSNETLNDILLLLFQCTIKKLEKNSPIETFIKKKVWEEISPEKLKILKKALVREYCNKIFKEYTNEEITQVLDKHKATGQLLYSPCIEKYFYSKPVIIGTIMQGISKSFFIDVMQALEKKKVTIVLPKL